MKRGFDITPSDAAQWIQQAVQLGWQPQPSGIPLRCGLQEGVQK